ncbi:hypothetical protein LRQ09_13905 [Acinetobacter soli]|uniref:hypothetical protein n=1 Tax=Acinetobacter soli TaxID=487316 RepID=UPI00123038D0|nr:hypothetical protein [Acinetobacter soli]MCF3128457.1 hypothetical protein [Acinetobacter soli]
MSQRTFLENFSVTSEGVLVEAVNKHARRLQLEILSLSVIHNPNSKYPIKAVVLFEKKIVLNPEHCECEGCIRQRHNLGGYRPCANSESINSPPRKP